MKVEEKEGREANDGRGDEPMLLDPNSEKSMTALSRVGRVGKEDVRGKAR